MARWEAGSWGGRPVRVAWAQSVTCVADKPPHPWHLLLGRPRSRSRERTRAALVTQGWSARVGPGLLNCSLKAWAASARRPPRAAQGTHLGGWEADPYPGCTPSQEGTDSAAPGPAAHRACAWSHLLLTPSAAAMDAGIITTSRTRSCIPSKSWPPFWTLRSLRTSSVMWACECKLGGAGARCPPLGV